MAKTMTMEEKINHPFYCVWCGNIAPDKESFERHYQSELDRMDEANKRTDIFDAIYNDNHY